ncbi:hypothetical protein BDF21DRAFT_426604 [Thamnidium elegans]|nr:hypothetical protein BDF21DRAFT_426604 [Thamnidium elegans]
MEGQENILDSYESTENALMDSFKAAALKVTTLYKDSLVQNRKAYAAGYQQALQDLYEFISSQPENGYIPVEQVLSFARQKNSQLTVQMGHVPPPPPPHKPVVEEKNPFQIDPHAQFTFTHDVPLGLWDQATNQTIMNDGKRRIVPNEISFMGRSMNMETGYEPPFKRGRSRREDFLQQQQHQQQQFQQPHP